MNKEDFKTILVAILLTIIVWLSLKGIAYSLRESKSYLNKLKAYEYELRMNNYLQGYNDALEGRQMDSNYISPNPYLK